MKTNWMLATAAAALMLSSTAMAQEKGAGDHMDGDHKKHRQEMMEKVDTDKDGKISKEEFITSHEEKFEKMDTDSDGLLSDEERKAAWENHRGKMKERMKDWRADKSESEGAEGEAPETPADESAE